jgi:hypothetical protein
MTDRMRGEITITGGTFTGSAVGVGEVRVTNAGPSTTTIGDLQGLLTAERARLVGAAPTPEAGEKVSSAVEALEDELASSEPDGETVRGTWKRIQKLIDGGASVAGSVAKISEAVGTIFGP